MKGKLSFMWRATLALVLVLSLGVVMAAPVAAAPDVSNVWVQLGNYEESTSTTYSIYFTPGAALTKDTDTINVIFPTGTTLGSVAATVYPDGDLIADPPAGTSASTVVTGGTRVTVTTPVAISAGVQVLLELTNITNPATDTADTGETLQLYTSQETTFVTSMGYTIEEASAHPVTSVDFTATQDTAGATAEYIVDFNASSSGALAAGWGKVTIIFPPEVTLPASMLASDVAFKGTGGSDVDLTIDPVISGRFVTITVPDALANSAQGLVTFKQSAGIQNPTVTSSSYAGKLCTSEDTGIVNSTSYTAIIPASISQLVFVTADSDAVVGVNAAAALKVETQDQYGNDSNVGADVTIALSSTSATGLFDADAVDGLFADDEDTISSGYNWATFWYKDSVAGSFTITVAESPSLGWTDATWDITVEAVHVVSLYDSNDVLIDTYTTIQAAINAAMAEDTIKVEPGTYVEGITVGVADLTIESTGGMATTFIEGGMYLTADADDFVLGGAAGKGFTLQGGTDFLIRITGPEDVEISYNTFDTTRTPGAGNIDALRIEGSPPTSGLTVTGNTFSLADLYDAGVRSYPSAGNTSGWTITDNAFTGTYPTIADQSAIELNTLDIETVDSTISGNEITAIKFGVAIGAGGGQGLVGVGTNAGTLEISGNTFDGCDYGIYLIDVPDDNDDQNVVITQNTFTGNTNGLAISADAHWLLDANFIVEYNDFSGNTYAVYNSTSTTDVLPAENNYWGSATGPTIAANAGGTGDAVSAYVDYSPWLDAAGGNPVKIFDLETGWNLISLPLRPTDSDIDTVLAGVDVTVNKVAYFTGGPAGTWKSWFPSPTPSDLYTMDDGKGYWIDVSAAGTLTATGVELALPGQTPPTYDVVVGWNLIGVTSTTSKSIEDYLGPAIAGTGGTLEAIYGFNASTGVYFIPETNLNPGNGYWLAVNTAGKIYP